MIYSSSDSKRCKIMMIENQNQEIQKLKKELYDIIANHSGQPFEKVQADSDRDYWMIAQEAKEYGMVDDILVRKKEDIAK